MSTHEKLRVAVVGVGALGRHHARILSQLPGAKLVAVADANQAQGEAVASSCGCEWTSDYRTLFGKIDAVSLVVPTSLHRRIGEDFLNEGIPLLVEKPLTATVAEGQQLVHLAGEQNLTLQVGHIERFNPAFQALAQRSGAPKYIRCERVSPYAFRSMDIGAIHDLMIHDIELVLSLVKEQPVQVEAFGVTLVGGFEDCVQARLVFPGGCIAEITANRVAPHVSRTMQCWSDRGCVTADLQTRSVTSFTPGAPLLNGDLPFEMVRDGRSTAADLKPEIFSRFIQHEQFQAANDDALTAELQSFLDCVRTGEAPLVSGVQALAALKVAERVKQSVASHQWDGTADGRCGPDALLQHYLPQSAPGRAAA
ncbi:Gfo/Idh/MocA family oxidoreductase [Planctomicrobium sp. SH664]|uniref:Gfo/Idh/MocA family oxidoreductase n=1 Tax=Planctomicrobium sp. SH664 TaxID=3448125 RepID=UPI003F5C44B2